MLQDLAPPRPRLQRRRPPAHASMSSRQGSLSPASSACSRRAQPAQDDDIRKSTLASSRSPIRRSSDESNESAAAPVDTWFHTSNKNVGGRLGQQWVDNDPPFFMQSRTYNLPHLATDVDGHGFTSRVFASTRSQFGPEIFPEVTNESSTDDFRSVIDDLTIENQKLRERLRKYENPRSSHLERDKLFEVKVHGLTPSKKRELEEALLAFASGISKDESTSTSTSQQPLQGSRNPTTTLRHGCKNPSSLSTSNSRVVDSAYASLSTSGPDSFVSNRVSGGKMTGGSLLAAPKVCKVQSFLDETPLGLLPKQSTTMTERGKKKLVVRRLEQIFTGKLRASAGPNSQPLLQQEVSNSAARDDRRAIESQGHHVSVEGIREASILPKEVELENMTLPRLSRGTSGNSSEEAEDNAESLSFPDQRPTRPLDLDPERAQIPAENIEYIRHLGISTPDLAPGDLTDAEDGHGWVYLNLLINMAQLHIINVTPDFVRSSVTEMSTQFQLSQDGSKIRWKGGTEGTEMSSDSGADNALQHSPNDSDRLGDSNKKRRKMNNDTHQISLDDSRLEQQRFLRAPITVLNQPYQTSGRKHQPHYKPLFAHRPTTEDEDTSLYHSTSQIPYMRVNDSSTDQTIDGVQSTGPRSHLGPSSKRKRGDGPIVFYSGAPFCTDLSGDSDRIYTPIYATDVGMDGCSNRSHDALGCKLSNTFKPFPSRSSSGSEVSTGPFEDQSVCVKPFTKAEERSKTPEILKDGNTGEMEFSPKWTEDGEQEGYTPMCFDVCGLGCTRPADHFAVLVKTRRKKLDPEAKLRYSKFLGPGPKIRRILHQIPKFALDLFRERDASREEINLGPQVSPIEPFIKNEILSTAVHHLDPSELPPPATYHWALTSSIEGSEDASTDSEGKSSKGVRRQPHISHRKLSSTSVNTPVAVPYDEGDEGESIDSESEDSESSSIDMLAYARRVGPESVTAKEQIFEREAMTW